MVLTPLTSDDIEFAFECLLTLRGQVSYSPADLRQYCERWALLGPTSPMLIARMDGVPVGLLTCNRLAVPRYLGFGIELEEVVVAPAFQGQGVAGRMIDAFLEWAGQQPELRRVQVRTDDHERAGRVYARRFSVAQTTVYARTVHRL
jgi:RimJ/RimL family protein N-acetyltransferase